MCQWFSCVSDGTGKIYYFDAKQRNLLRGGKAFPAPGHATPISYKEVDSHSGICAYFGLDCDKVNKYEFRPLDRKFITDQINGGNDEDKVKRKLQRLDYQKLAPPELTIKPIFHPLRDVDRKDVTKADIALLQKWDSVGASVRDSVWASVRAYVSSFFALETWKYIKHKKGENPFQPGIDLWMRGIVPSFDGKTWRLHGGKDGKVLKEIVL